MREFYINSTDNAQKEINDRILRGKNILEYGVSFLDDALRGIKHNDLILLGAQSGIGKTALCCNIALANIENGKRVHYVALEAEECEIESRLKYKIISDMFFADSYRPRIDFNFSDWYMGKCFTEMIKYEEQARDYYLKAYKDKLFIHYKQETYGIDEFIESVIIAARSTDLIIIDHVHYFDMEDENENRGIKQIASMARTLAIEKAKPIILVGHLRKKDRNNPDLVPDMYEFHGSSELYKIATTVITFAPGPMTSDGKCVTYFRVPKYRIDGGVHRFLGKINFDPKKGSYDEQYILGNSNQAKDDDFREVDAAFLPKWYRKRQEGKIISSRIGIDGDKTVAAPYDSERQGMLGYISRPYRDN